MTTVRKTIPVSLSQTLITGVYRTGTEFVTQLINCHPAISASMYRINVPRFVAGRYDPISSRENQVRALDDLAARLKERYQIELEKAAVLAELERRAPVDYGVLYDVLMSWLYLAQSEARHWAEKNQLLWREIPEFLRTMKNGRAVLVLRDPRPVTLSFKKYTYAPPPAYLGAAFNCLDAMLHARELAQGPLASRFLCVRYEDAVADPQGTARRIWSFIGLEGDADVSDRANWKDAYGQPWHANSSFHSNDDKRPFDAKAAVSRWKTELSPAELSLIEGVCGQEMRRNGYEPSLPKIDWPAAKALFAGDEAITAHFEAWEHTGRGIQAFPTDPVKRENWRK